MVWSPSCFITDPTYKSILCIRQPYWAEGAMTSHDHFSKSSLCFLICYEPQYVLLLDFTRKGYLFCRGLLKYLYCLMEGLDLFVLFWIPGIHITNKKVWLAIFNHTIWLLLDFHNCLSIVIYVCRFHCIGSAFRPKPYGIQSHLIYDQTNLLGLSSYCQLWLLFPFEKTQAQRLLTWIQSLQKRFMPAKQRLI